MLKVNRFFSFWKLFTLLCSSLLADEIYNFPDLIRSVQVQEEINTNLIIKRRAWSLVTNDSYFNLYGDSLSSYPYLKKQLDRIVLNDFIANPISLFDREFFIYDANDRRLLSEVRRKKNNANTNEQKPLVGLEIADLETHMRLFGEQTLTLSVGKEWRFIEQDPKERDEYKYRYLFGKDNETMRNPRHILGIAEGFTPNQTLNLRLSGKIGRKISVEVEHNSAVNNNSYSISYKGDSDELVKSVSIGEVQVNSGGKSSFGTAGGSTKEAFGLHATGAKGPLTFSGGITVTKGISQSYDFSVGTQTIKDVDYIKNRFFAIPHQIPQNRHAFYVALGDKETNKYNLKLETARGVFYFEEVPKDKYIYDETRKILNTLGRTPNTTSHGWSLFFYDGGESYTNQIKTFIGTNYKIEHKITSPYSNFVIINIPSDVLTVDNVKYSLELRNHYRIPRDIDFVSFKMQILNLNNQIIDSQSWNGTPQHRFAKAGGAVLNIENGYLYFENPKPLTNYKENYKGFYESDGRYDRNKMDLNSGILFRMEYDSQEGSVIELNAYNINRNSVRVYRGGVLLKRNIDYIVNAVGGTISFTKEAQLLPGEKVSVFYEYEGFGNSFQDFLTTGRVDYKLRGDSYVGGSIITTVGQSPLGRVNIGNEPSLQFITEVDTSLDLVSLLKRTRATDWSLIASGEYAFSLVDKNTKNVAIFNTMENATTPYMLPGAYMNYYFTANPTLESENRHLGKSYFIDHNEYNSSGSPTRISYSFEREKELWERDDSFFGKRGDVNFRPFSVRPGPYVAYSEGQLDRVLYPSQNALVFDYNFDPYEVAGDTNLGYVSWLTTVGYGSSGRDFSRFNAVEIVYKLTKTIDHDSLNSSEKSSYKIVNENNEHIGLSLEVGALYGINEDLDLDQNLDQELSSATPEGFSFNYINSHNPVKKLNTYIGGGIKGWSSRESIIEGNGRLDTEDLTGRGVLVKEDNPQNMIKYPNIDTTGDSSDYINLYSSQWLEQVGNTPDALPGAIYEIIENSQAELEGGGGSDPYQDTKYVKLTIPLNILTNANLSAAKLLRLNLLETVGSAKRGRLLVDSLTFKAMNFRGITVDGKFKTNNTLLSAKTINSQEDIEYQLNHLAKAYRNTYEKIHSTLLPSQFDTLDESALELTYNLNGIKNMGSSDNSNGILALVENRENPIDLSAYREFKFFININESDPEQNESFVLRFGHSTNDYYQLSIPFKYIGEPDSAIWHEYTIHIRSKGSEKDELDRKKGDNYFAVSKRTEKIKSEGNKDKSVPELIAAEEYSLIKIGDPELDNITYDAFGIRGPNTKGVKGKIWVNELFVKDDMIQFGNSYRLGLRLNNKGTIKYKNIEILSGLNVESKFLHSGLNFSSAGSQQPSRTQREEASIDLSGTLFKTLGLKYYHQNYYDTTDWDIDLVSLKSQAVKDFVGKRLDISVNHPSSKLKKWLPPLRHTTSQNTERTIKLTALTNYSPTENIRDFSAAQEILNYRNYSLGENHKWQITKDFSIGQSYDITTSYRRKTSFKTNIPNNKITMFDPDYLVPYPLQVIGGNQIERRHPIYGNFPDVEDLLTKSSNTIKDLTYSYDISQTFTFNLDYKRFGVNGTAFFSEAQELILTNGFTTNYQKILNNYDSSVIKDKWYEFYWPELRSIYLDPFVENDSRRTSRKRNFNFALRGGEQIEIKKFPVFPKLTLSGSFNYSESLKYYPESSFFDVTNFLKYHSGDETFNSTVIKLGQFYTNKHFYRDIANRYSLTLETPLTYNDLLIRAIRSLRFTRDLTVNENGVLFDTTDSDSDKRLWETIKTNDSLSQYYYPVGGKKSQSTRMQFSLKDGAKIMVGTPPFIDFWLINNIYALILDASKSDRFFQPQNAKEIESLNTFERERSRILNRYRLMQLENLDDMVGYLGDQEGRATSIEHFGAHRGYQKFATVRDSYSISIDLNSSKLKFLDLFLPNNYSLNSSLVSSRDTIGFSQEQVRTFQTSSKSFTVLAQALNKILPPGKGYDRKIVTPNLSFNYKDVINYKQKTSVKTANLRGSTGVKLLRNLDLSLDYTLSSKESRTSYRYFIRNEDGAPLHAEYMGLGELAVIYVTNVIVDESGNRKEEIYVLNVGDKENPDTIKDVKDMGSVDAPTILELAHNLKFKFSWKSDKPFTLRLFKNSFTLPTPPSDSLGFDLRINSHIFTDIDRNQLKKGDYNFFNQKHPLAYKDLTAAYPYESKTFEKWKLTTTYLSTMKINNNFSIALRFDYAMAQQMILKSYLGYLKVELNETTKSIFIREEDYIQFGGQVGATIKILF